MDLIPYLQPIATFSTGAISSVVSSLLTAFFLRRDTHITEFEKIKSRKFAEVLNELLVSGKMTYMELYKCKNFLSIAKFADQAYSDQNEGNNQNSKDTEDNFNIDWFMRFFDAVGNISNEDMQRIWSSLLKQEVQEPGKFSLRTMECLRNMNFCEAEMFSKLASIVFETDRVSGNGTTHHILPSLDIDVRDYNKAYTSVGVDIDKMIEIELLHTVMGYFRLPEEIGKEVVLAETIGNTIICKKVKMSAIPTVINVRTLTGIGEQLLNIVDPVPNIVFANLTVNHWRKNTSLEFRILKK